MNENKTKRLKGKDLFTLLSFNIICEKLLINSYSNFDNSSGYYSVIHLITFDSFQLYSLIIFTV